MTFPNVRKGTGALVQRIPNPEHMERAVAARAWLRDNDPDNVRVAK